MNDRKERKKNLRANIKAMREAQARLEKDMKDIMSSLADLSSDVQILSDVIASPFRPDIIYRNGLCVNFTQGREVCDINKLAEFDAAEVRYRTQERNLAPETLAKLWHEVYESKTGLALVLPVADVTVYKGNRGFIPPVDTLVRRVAETHVISFDAPPGEFLRHAQRDIHKWLAGTYYSQGEDNKKFELLEENDETYFKIAFAIAGAILSFGAASADISSQNGAMEARATGRILTETRDNIRAMLSRAFNEKEYQFSGNSIPILNDIKIHDSSFSQYTIYNNTSMSLVMACINVIIHTRR